MSSSSAKNTAVQYCVLLSSNASSSTTSVPAPVTPVAPEERSPSLDILRGFCLFGILFMNITTFVGFWFPPFGFGLDEVGSSVNYWTELLVTSSFRPSLALLFGLGFALQLRRNPKALGRFSLRLLALLAFGLVHGFGIWYGDILTEYALVGFLLIPFAKRSNVTVVIWSLLVFLAIPIIGSLTDNSYYPLDETTIAYTFTNGSWLEVVRTNAQIFAYYLRVGAEYVPQTISCFLLGLWLGRVGALERPQKHRLFLLGALVLMSALAWWGHQRNINSYDFFFDQFFASPTLGFAYIAALALLISFKFFERLFYFFSYIGRMPLTTYLTASVVLSFLFYGYGLGWYGQFYSGEWVYVALILYGSQVVFSFVWLKFFRVGPLEWLWRSLTYGKLQPLRKGTVAAYSAFGVEKAAEVLETPLEEPKATEPVETLETDWQEELAELSTSDDSQTLEQAQDGLEEINQSTKPDDKSVPK